MLQSFFKDTHGNLAVIQRPNALIVIWVALQLISLVLLDHPRQGLHTLSFAVLFTWSYLELTQGISPFRKLLGAIIMLGSTLLVMF